LIELLRKPIVEKVKENGQGEYIGVQRRGIFFLKEKSQVILFFKKLQR
jgi:hypothetical protein